MPAATLIQTIQQKCITLAEKCHQTPPWGNSGLTFVIIFLTEMQRRKRDVHHLIAIVRVQAMRGSQTSRICGWCRLRWRRIKPYVHFRRNINQSPPIQFSFFSCKRSRHKKEREIGAQLKTEVLVVQKIVSASHPFAVLRRKNDFRLTSTTRFLQMNVYPSYGFCFFRLLEGDRGQCSRGEVVFLWRYEMYWQWLARSLSEPVSYLLMRSQHCTQKTAHESARIAAFHIGGAT